MPTTDVLLARMAALAWLAVLGPAGAVEGISVSSTSRYVLGGRWDWTVFVRAGPEVLSQIQCVEYTLDPTFPNPVRRVCERGSDAQPFALSSNGWGGFTIPTSVFFRDGKEQRLEYRLALAPLPETARPPERAATGLDCDTQINVTIAEGFIRLVKGRTQNISIYAEQIHGTGSSSLYIVNATVDRMGEVYLVYPDHVSAVYPDPVPGTGAYRVGPRLSKKDFTEFVRNAGIRPAVGSYLAPKTYAVVSVDVAKAATLNLPSGKLSLAIANPANHGNVDVHVCLPD